MSGEHRSDDAATPAGVTAFGPSVDVDRLSDYLGGALDGTPAEAEVAELIRTDPAWENAYRMVSGAHATIRDELATLADVPEPMPSEVLFRLTAAVRAAEPGTDTGKPADHAVRHLPATDARRARRRHARWALAAAAAVVLIALVGLAGSGGMFSGGSQPDSTLSSAKHGASAGASAPGRAGPGQATMAPNHDNVAPDGAKVTPPAQAGTPLTASGTDYTPADLTDVLHRSTGAGTSLAPQAQTRVPDALRRLVLPEQLHQCLRAVTAVHPGTTQLVDYARFQGVPALVVVLDDRRTGRTRFVVVGQSCGTDGAQVLYSTS